MSFLRWLTEKSSVESSQDSELFGEQAQGLSHRKAHEDSRESSSSSPRRDTMGSYLPDSSSYELLTVIGKGLDESLTVNSARYKPTGEHVAIRRIDLESCTNDMVTYSQDGQVCMSGSRSIFSLIRNGQRAKMVHDFPQYSVKVSPWLSPEVLQQNLQGYDFRSDIYSLGITACELANGHVPFKDMPATQMLSEKSNGTVPCLSDTSTIPPEESSLKPSRSAADSGICEGPRVGGLRNSNGEPSSSSGGHPYNRTFSPQFHSFVESCLQRDPENRPSASTLIGHPFFKQIKRRPAEASPESSQPVSPITCFESAGHQDSVSGSASLESGLGHSEVDDWDF